MTALSNNSLMVVPAEYLQEVSEYLDPSSAISFSRVNKIIHDLILKYWDNLLPIFITKCFHYPLHPDLLPPEQFQRLYIAEKRAGIIRQRMLAGHEGGCRTLLMSRNSPRILSSGRGGEVKLWDPISGRCLRKFNANHTFAGISDDGKRAVSFSHDPQANSLTLWNLEREEMQCDIPLLDGGGNSCRIHHVGMSDDGNRVLCLYALILLDGEEKWTLKIFDGTGNLQSALTIDQPCSTGNMNREGTRVVRRLLDKSLQLLDLTTGNCMFTLDKFKCFYMTPDGTRAFIRLGGALVDEEGESVWLDLHSGALEKAESLDIAADTRFHEFRINRDATRALTISHAREQIPQYWDLTTGKCLHMLIDDSSQGRPVPTKSVFFTANEKRAVSLDRSGILRLWDLDTGECLHEIRERRGRDDVQRGLRLDAYGMTAVSSTRDGKISVWNLTPLFDEYLGALAKSFRWGYPGGEEKFNRLPNFVQDGLSRELSYSRALQDMRPLMGFHGLPCAVPYRSLCDRELADHIDSYVGRTFLIEMAEIIRKCELAPIEARVANLPDSIQQRVYKEIVWQQSINDTLPQVRPYNYGELAFHSREGYSSTPEEKRAALLAVWDMMEREHS